MQVNLLFKKSQVLYVKIVEEYEIKIQHFEVSVEMESRHECSTFL